MQLVHTVLSLHIDYELAEPAQSYLILTACFLQKSVNNSAGSDLLLLIIGWECLFQRKQLSWLPGLVQKVQKRLTCEKLKDHFEEFKGVKLE